MWYDGRVDKVERAIVNTLAYSDVFDYPLTAPEVYRFLVAERPIEAVLVRETLRRMSVDRKLIEADGEYYFLRRRRRTAVLRESHRQPSGKKLLRARRAARLLRLVPWLELIGITGKLAMADSDEEDDIDLMFVTRRNRLWLSRGLVVFILLFLGLYRRPKKIKNMICPNLFLSEEALEWPEKNLFTAHEVLQMKPLWGRNGAYEKFLEANVWVKKFLPNAPFPESGGRAEEASRPALELLSFLGFVLDWLERLAFGLQLWYMRKKKTIETTTPRIACFHPLNAGDWVLREYKKRLTHLTSAL